MKKLTRVLIRMGGAISVLALLLGQASAARACAFIFYQPDVPESLKEEE